MEAPLRIELTLVGVPGLICTMLPWGMLGVVVELISVKLEGTEAAAVVMILPTGLGISMLVVAVNRAENYM